MKIIFTIIITTFLYSCTSTKSTIKNIDPNAIRPKIVNNAYVITDYANDNNYGYDPDYPINLGPLSETQEEKNISYFFEALQGPNQEKISYLKTDTCCPFPTNTNNMGAGTLSLYEVTFEGSTNKITLYFNIYEKGQIVCPKGLKIKKTN
ncbi:2-dehydro-3-deoxyphosphooctonate aldolase [Flavobacterium sp. 9AF]|uniref:2-dehydro-3-deoxyphosphooctonate aldolase n=1 Tax=Flavobacterium sp. 9AF TaxID=2653142 RepID=UPI0012F3C01F|nr:2-dehydro-3-deoxyphosphooctonate aldolase [Flavobacterium sp. 9AF]VXC26023.1 2-dehydro-3-deoxyphosphooctonate aldolase [Flavobacterium sp. 9AF]